MTKPVLKDACIFAVIDDERKSIADFLPTREYRLPRVPSEHSNADTLQKNEFPTYHVTPIRFGENSPMVIIIMRLNHYGAH
jgi:hypothetical protein